VRREHKYMLLSQLEVCILYTDTRQYTHKYYTIYDYLYIERRRRRCLRLTNSERGELCVQNIPLNTSRYMYVQYWSENQPVVKI